MVWGKLNNSYLQCFENKSQECATNGSQIVSTLWSNPELFLMKWTVWALVKIQKWKQKNGFLFLILQAEKDVNPILKSVSSDRLEKVLNSFAKHSEGS